MRKIARLFIIVTLVTSFIGWPEAATAGRGAYTNSETQALADGVSITVHHNNDVTDRYVDSVLQYAVEAYNNIVHTQGFNKPGFTFANPDKSYCYDRDKTIDIYINSLFQSPYYDTVNSEGAAYDAVILFPQDYKSYLAKDSSRGFTDSEVATRMRGTIFHEMFHLITYSYNKHIESWYRHTKGVSIPQGGDWYVEALPRYFETIADSYDNFFAEGFIEKTPKKTITSKEGANYLMENPTGSLKDARYDYSLFWAYIHKNYGMDKIEEISRRFRFISADGMEGQVSAIIGSVLNEDFESLLRGFALALYFKHFNPDIRNGLNDLRVMSLNDFTDSPHKKVSSWASNFIALDLDAKDTPQSISFKKAINDGLLKMTILAGFKDGRIVQLRKLELDKRNTICEMDINGMKDNGIKKLILIVTNTNPDCSVGYSLINR